MPRTRDNDEDIPVMEASNLTDAERRDIRRRQRELFKEIEEQDNLGVEEARDRNNEIYEKVRYTREAVLDAENMTQIANKAVKKADRIIEVPRYDADRLVSKLVQKCRSSNAFDWAALGREAGVCFNAIPSGVCFLNGPLTDGQQLQVRQRTQRARLQTEEEDAKEEQPEDVKGHTARDADTLSSVETNMKVLDGTLHKLVDDRYRAYKRHLNEVYNEDIPKQVTKKLKKTGVEICATKYLFNPDSFTQTVENIFHFAFLIKQGSASIAVREEGFYSQDGLKSEGGPRVKYTNANNIDTTAKQAIVSLTMKDWREMCKAYNVTQGDLPHRTGSKHAKRTSLSQQSSDT